MNIFLLLLVNLALVLSANCGQPLPSMTNLDLSHVSRLRVELRNVEPRNERCRLFWEGLRVKLSNGDRLDRKASLMELKLRLENKHQFEKLIVFVGECVSLETGEGEGALFKDLANEESRDARKLMDSKKSGALIQSLTDEVGLMRAKVLELENKLREKEDADKKPLEKQGGSKLTIAFDSFKSSELNAIAGRVKNLVLELGAKGERIDKLVLAEPEERRKKEGEKDDIDLLREQLQFVEQQLAELKIELENMDEDHKEELERLRSKVNKTEWKLRYLEVDLKKVEEEMMLMKWTKNRW